MKLAELAEKTVYAYRPRTSEDQAKPAMVVEPKLWSYNEVFGNWDGEADRTKKTVVTRAAKGDRAGRSTAYHSTNFGTGVPVLVIEAIDYRWTSSKVRLAELPLVILFRAWKQMNPDRLMAEGHDGRFTSEILPRTKVEVLMSDGTTESVTVVLEFIRPQALIGEWNSYFAAKKEAIEQEAGFQVQQDERRRQNDLTAHSIRTSVDALLGPAEQRSESSERPDVHRKFVPTGISTTYEVSESTLLRLLALAQKGSSQ